MEGKWKSWESSDYGGSLKTFEPNLICYRNCVKSLIEYCDLKKDDGFTVDNSKWCESLTGMWRNGSGQVYVLAIPPKTKDKWKVIRKLLYKCEISGGRIIIILDKIASHVGKFEMTCKATAQSYGNCRISIYSWEDFNQDPIENAFIDGIPKPRIITLEEAKRLCLNYEISYKNLPQISTRDPVAIYLQAEEGSVLYFTILGLMGFALKCVWLYKYQPRQTKIH